MEVETRREEEEFFRKIANEYDRIDQPDWRYLRITHSRIAEFVKETVRLGLA